MDIEDAVMAFAAAMKAANTRQAPLEIAIPPITIRPRSGSEITSPASMPSLPCSTLPFFSKSFGRDTMAIASHQAHSLQIIQTDGRIRLKFLA